jgi:glutaminase
MNDLISKPSHYQLCNVKSIDGVNTFDTDVLNILEALCDKIDSESLVLSSSVEPHYYSSALAYIMRAPFKGSLESDIKKAIFYLRLLINDDPRNTHKGV